MPYIFQQDSTNSHKK